MITLYPDQELWIGGLRDAFAAGYHSPLGVLPTGGGTLSEVEVARMRRDAARTQAAARTLEDLIALGTQRGMKNPAGWAAHVARARAEKQARTG